MKKIMLICFTMLLFLSLGTVEATLQSNVLPGGKNYLDEQNFYRDNISLVSIDEMYVRQNTEYTLSMPSQDLIGYTSIIVSGSDEYINGTLNALSECEEVGDLSICRFTTVDDYLQIEIYAENIGLYYSYYGFDKFQLEEGSIATPYEEYIYPLTDTTSPSFSGTGGYITSYNDTKSANDIVSSHITALDEIDGDVSDSIIIIEDNYTDFIGTVGSYSIVVEASDNSNNKSTFELVVIVKDEIKPDIQTDDVIIVDVDNQYDIDEIILENITITDEYDGSIGYLILTDQYTLNKSSIGSYDVSIQATDSSFNSTTKTVTINVVDLDSPILVSEAIYHTNLTEFESLDTVLSNIEFSDNYDETVEVIVSSDQYTNNENNVGTYFVDVLVKDSSNNSQIYTLTINVVDDVFPSITGPNSVSSSYQTPITYIDLLSLLDVSDNFSVLDDSDITIIEDTYLYTNEIGTYQITYQVSDEAGNTTTFVLTIDIVDDQSPIIFVDDYIVKITPDVSFTKEDALLLMFRNGLLQEDDYKIDVLINEYDGHETEKGMYLYQARFTSSDGEEYIKDFVIEVLGEEETNHTSLYASILLISTFSIYVVIKRKK